MRISDWSSDVCSSDLAVSSDAKPAVPTQAEVLKGTDWPALRLVSGDAWIDCDVAGAPLPGTVAIVPEPAPLGAQAAVASSPGQDRSEEHTSELKSLLRKSYTVSRLTKKHTLTHRIYSSEQHTK